MKSYTDTINEKARAHNDKLVMVHDNIRATDDAAKAVQKTPSRVSLDSIVEKIAHVEYIHPDRHPHMTIAVVTLKNGYVVIGKTAPADPLNFDAQLGQKFSYEDAVRQIWPLEGYLLREHLACLDQTSLT